ncbi:lysophospholipid acyltransferase family protein [Streptomyces sp. NPDC127084]|uniref:lysophospholipid acyltransferase family protein n=1 Tax=Streptomyces sp. NPDC127084 TaxID=3347133 RepID=UPI0036565C82
MSVWLPTAPCTPDGCATPRWPTVGRLRAVVRLLAGVAVVLAGIAVSPVAVPLGPDGRARLVRLWCRLIPRAFGVRVRVVGPAEYAGPGRAPLAVSGLIPGPRSAPATESPTGPGRSARRSGTLVVPNHVSWLDIPLVATVLPGRMLAKEEVRRWPVLGPLARFGGTLFVDRDRLRALPRLVGTMADALRGGARVVVFPEGSTWCGRAQGRFRNAAFQSALDAGVTVQPVRISYRPTGAAAFVGDDPLMASLWRVAAARGLTAEIRVLPPIPADRHTDRRTLARAAHAAVTADGTATGQVHTGSGAGTGSDPGTARISSVPATGSSAHTAVDSDSANLSAESVHHHDNFIPASASSVRTPS